MKKKKKYNNSKKKNSNSELLTDFKILIICCFSSGSSLKKTGVGNWYLNLWNAESNLLMNLSIKVKRKVVLTSSYLALLSSF